MCNISLLINHREVWLASSTQADPAPVYSTSAFMTAFKWNRQDIGSFLAVPPHFQYQNDEKYLSRSSFFTFLYKVAPVGFNLVFILFLKIAISSWKNHYLNPFSSPIFATVSALSKPRFTCSSTLAKELVSASNSDKDFSLPGCSNHKDFLLSTTLPEVSLNMKTLPSM